MVVVLLASSIAGPLSRHFFVGLLGAVGLSRHWRAWHKEQTIIVERVADLKSQGKLGQADLWLTLGHPYSRMGWFDHIEGASETWVPSACLRMGAGVTSPALPVSRHLEVEGEKITNQKYGTSYWFPANAKFINLSTGEVKKATPELLQSAIASLPQDHRHWFQYVDVKWVRNLIVNLMPRIEYFFR